MNTVAEIDRTDPPSSARVAPRQSRAIRRILVCLDQSPLSEGCLPYATFISRTFASSMTLLHVMQPDRERSGSTDALQWEISRQQATAYLERFEKGASEASGQRVETRLEQGRPAERIRGAAHEIGADLIVLGPSGEGGTTEWNLGTTAQQVLALVQGSVLIVRSDTAPVAAFTPQHLLVPLDGSLRSESTLPIAARIAKATGAEILLAHVVPELVPSGVLRFAEDEEVQMAHELARRLESRANTYLGQLQNSLAQEVRSVRTTVIRSADPSQSLLELCAREPIDFIVLSAHGSTCNRERSFGGMATHLLTHSTVPLLVLQDLLESDVHRSDLDTGRRTPVRSAFPKAHH